MGEEEKNYRIKVHGSRALSFEQLETIARIVSEALPHEMVIPSDLVDEKGVLKYKLTEEEAENLSQKLREGGIKNSLITPFEKTHFSQFFSNLIKDPYLIIRSFFSSLYTYAKIISTFFFSVFCIGIGILLVWVWNTTKPSRIAKPSDMEVDIKLKPVLFLGSGRFREIEYEGTVINTGFKIAPRTIIRLNWRYQGSEIYGGYEASSEKTFRNLRPGETRQISGRMTIKPIQGDSQAAEYLQYFGGLPDFVFSSGKSTCKVDVFPE